MSDDSVRHLCGVVAVVPRAGKLLVIKRSQLVRAPGMFCFPGGALEEGESEAAAIVRELREELSLAAVPVRPLWSSVTPWGVSLAWWLAEVDGQASPRCNAAEVESCHWLSAGEIRRLPNLLASNLEFLAAWERGEFAIEELET